MKSFRNISIRGISWMFVVLSLCLCMKGKQVEAVSSPQYDYIVTNERYNVNASDSAPDAEGIQKVLDMAIGSDRVITIYFPAGTYYIDKTLLVYSNTHIVLDDKAVVYRMDNLVDKMLLHNVDQNGKMDQVGGYNMSKNITLEGGTFDGGNTNLANKGTDVIRFDHAENITIKDCVVKNTYDCHIIELVGVKNGLVSGCTLEGFRYKKGKEKNYTYAREAIQLESAWTSNEKDLTDIESAWAKGSVIDGTSCQDVVVTDNTFIDMPCGVGQHRYTKSGKYRNQNITICNNTIDCSADLKYCKTAITCCGTNNLNVYGNRIKGNYRFAIHVLASDDVNIQNNSIENVTMNGIMVDKGRVTMISDNTIKNVKKHGISVGGGTVGAISNNVIISPKNNGISVDAGEITDITGNTIKSTGKNGISVSAKKSSSKVNIINISKNNITATKMSGIVVDIGKIENMNSNTIKKAGRHGISVVGGTVGKGKQKSKGIQNNTITDSKQNGITVSIKGTVSSIGKNKISGAKNNGISLTEKAKVHWVVNNTIKKCKKHGIWNGLNSKVTIKGNKGQTE